ncbi:MAG: ComEC family competence protein [Saprospiraceae bacterium]|nr:ComEC family competence protein [Saprospiraceae bacterium]
MITIHELPAFRLLIGLVSGILIYPLLVPITEGWIIVFCTCAGLSLITGYFTGYGFKNRFLSGILIFVTSIVLSIVLQFCLDDRHSDDHLIHLKDDNQKIQVIARCIDMPGKAKRWRIPMEAVEIIENNLTQPLKGKFLLFAENLTTLPVPGEIFRVNVRLESVGEPELPGMFDYELFLERQGIYRIGYVKPADLIKIKDSNKFYPKYMANLVRDWCIRRCRLLLGDNELNDVAMGLMFGYRDNIDQSTQQAFVNTGAVHLLAVSGMHVVLVYANIMFLLRIFRVRKLLGKKGEVWIGVFFLWCFAFVAGLAASIVRATIMLTIILLGKCFDKQGLSLNILCATAVLMLVYNPGVLYDVGFQLSFLAVAGIILMEPGIKKLMPEWVLKFNGLASMITVTIAAQTATLPIILFYFHQIPVYFILSGIVAVFLADWVIKIGFGIVLTSIFSVKIAAYFSLGWKAFIWSLLESVGWIERLPFALIKDVYFNKAMAWIAGGMVLLTIVRIQAGLKNYRNLMLISLIVLMLIDVSSLYKAGHTTETREFTVRKKRIILERVGFQSIAWIESGLDSAYLEKSLVNFMINERINQVRYEIVELDKIKEMKSDNEYFSVLK